MPGSDLEFFKLNYRGEIYYPITRKWTLRFRGELGYGEGYGDTTGLPFYENFFSGGFGSVRGYESNTLGPRSTPAEIYDIDRPVTALDENGNPTAFGSTFGYLLNPETGKLDTSFARTRRPEPFGGNVLIEGGAELIFPLPFIKDQSQIRSAFFVDMGNVFDTGCSSSQVNCFDVDVGELRYSVGVGVTWITGFGPMTFSLAKPLNPGPDDREEVFQFTLGRGF